MNKEFLGNIDIKSLITIVALLLWVVYTVAGIYFGKFDDVFDYFKEVFLTVVAFYLGTRVNKEE